jgi:hypothetical protein
MSERSDLEKVDVICSEHSSRDAPLNVDDDRQVRAVDGLFELR